jgi:tetratricopeptide (TPR) repeat protein
MERVIAAYQSGAVDEQTLIDALDTQVAAEDWEAAAEASLIYGEWLTVYEPDTTRAHQIEAQGAEYVSRSGSQRLAVRLATIRAFRLLNAGREADAVALLQPAIEEAERFGDPVGLARLKSVQGDALVGLGEIRGLEQMREAAATLARAGDQSSDMNAHNLSEVLFAVGDLHEAHRTRKSAEALAQRFGKALSTAAIQCGLAKSAYHSGDWNTASALTTLLSDDASQYIAGDARWTRGRILLARGDLSTPFAYATERLDAGVRAAHEEWLMEGFALRIITLIAAGKTREAAETCSQLFDRWRDVGGMAASSDALAEVATTGLEPDRVGEAAALLPAISRWKPALLATSDCRFAEAAIAFKELGSAPLEAASHLRAAEQAVEQGRSAQANHHARLALEFYTAVDATLHVTHAESLLAVSA